MHTIISLPVCLFHLRSPGGRGHALCPCCPQPCRRLWGGGCSLTWLLTAEGAAAAVQRSPHTGQSILHTGQDPHAIGGAGPADPALSASFYSPLALPRPCHPTFSENENPN